MNTDLMFSSVTSRPALDTFNPVDLAWAAGIVDGEGCIHIKYDKVTERSRHKSPHYALLLLVTMIEENTIKELRDLFGVGRISSHTPHGSRKAWRWQCYPRDAAYVLCLILPFLRNKRRQAELALQFVDLGTGQRGRQRTDPRLVEARRSLYWELRGAKQ